jgi:hypothetical protein
LKVEKMVDKKEHDSDATKAGPTGSLMADLSESLWDDATVVKSGFE